MTANLRVLIAHFDPDTLNRMEAMLRATGAEVSVARDGPAALAIAAAQLPSIALLSTLLPGLNGFEVCRVLLRSLPGNHSLSVIMLSDVDDPYVRARARHVGAKKVLIEPVTPETVQEVVEMPWEAVDPMEFRESKDSRKGDQLFRDLLGTNRSHVPQSLISKVTDPLTGLVNSDYMHMKIEEELKRAGRYQQPLSLVVVQINNFEELTQKYGRQAGDEALLEVAGVFLCESRDVDIAGRSGRGQFHLLLPNTDSAGAVTVAQRLSQSLSERTLALDGDEVGVDVAIGYATTGSGRLQSKEDFLAEAVNLLNRSRKGGKGTSLTA